MSDMRDDQLLARIAEMLEMADPMPDAVVEAAKAVFTWRTIDAELAALQFDSATEELVGVRSAETVRQLTFAADDLEIEVTVLSDRIVGQLVPPQPGEITLRDRSGESSAQTDGLGRFTIERIPRGPVRLTCGLADRTVQTEWTIL